MWINMHSKYRWKAEQQVIVYGGEARPGKKKDLSNWEESLWPGVSLSIHIYEHIEYQRKV